MTEQTPAGRPATSTDVARLAGVSQATVSYVLNDAPGVKISAETRARVRDAAEHLGYAPHASARVLRTGRSDIVLTVPPSVPIGRLAAEFMNVLAERLSEHGYTSVLYGDGRSQGVTGAREWAQWRPAAVLVDSSRLTRAAVRQLHAAGTATVICLGAEPSPFAPTFVFDDAGIGACAAEHLLARGRTAPAVVVPAEPGLKEYGERRLKGVVRVAAEHGLPVQRVDLPFDEARAGAVVAGWAATPRRPDAVFAYNDDYAMLIMRALLDAGLDIPGDIAVVGADDLPLGPLLRPRLTSVRAIGGLAAEEVADRMHEMVIVRDRDPATVVELTRSEIVVRESS